MPPRLLFGDAFYWAAFLNPSDAFHARVTAFARGLGMTRVVTTDEALTEVANWFSPRWGPHWRGEATASKGRYHSSDGPPC